MSEGQEGSRDRLVYMANQIAQFFESQPEATRLAGAVDHLVKFWSPAMRQRVVAHLDSGGDGLVPFARHVVEKLRG